MQEFIKFIREQGVVGLAIGFILGGAVSSLVSSFVNDIINPIIGAVFGSSSSLSYMMIGPIALGSFLAAVIDFIIIAAVVFYGFKKLGLDRLDVPKA